MVLLVNPTPVKFAGRYTTLVGTQLESHSLVYAVAHAVQLPYKAYMILAFVGNWSQKSDVKNHHHCQLADVGVKICDAPQSIPIIASAKIPKA